MKFHFFRAAGLMASFFGTAALALGPAAAAGPVKMDANNDGKVSAEEHVAGSAKMFTAMDANKDGKVTAKEMEAAHQRVTGSKADPMEMSAEEKIKAVDIDNDGMLTTAEHAAGSQLFFETMDADRDGSLSKVELEEGRKLLKKQAAPVK